MLLCLTQTSRLHSFSLSVARHKDDIGPTDRDATDLSFNMLRRVTCQNTLMTSCQVNVAVLLQRLLDRERLPQEIVSNWTQEDGYDICLK